MVKHSTRKKLKEKVYRIVMSIPFGNTITYKEIGIKVGALNPRVVGKILSKNDKLIAIPCHRVICSNGKTGGYRAGEDFKKHLIDWEKSIIGS